MGEADGEEERGQLRDLPSPGPRAVVPGLVPYALGLHGLVVREAVVPRVRSGRRVPAPVGGISRFAHGTQV
ncbi:hypothetical protein GCM10010116_01420 [Microbispora rosea subsp. aerata]|nr:hypothetical protein GCM10010116_01420 [Microbispora rosea subsp. aerata]GLJ84378.1 hypothetical protein GCM10017588_31060 [Microbispora rosea subsp. aerata]